MAAAINTRATSTRIWFKTLWGHRNSFKALFDGAKRRARTSDNIARDGFCVRLDVHFGGRQRRRRRDARTSVLPYRRSLLDSRLVHAQHIRFRTQNTHTRTSVRPRQRTTDSPPAILAYTRDLHGDRGAELVTGGELRLSSGSM